MNMYAKARRSAGLTQRQAARALGLSVSLLGRYERDESCPDRRMVESMALLYGYRPDVWASRAPVRPESTAIPGRAPRDGSTRPMP